jgi:hypothetical protein
MSNIQRIIHAMDNNQQKEFVYFIQRNKYRKGRKDLQLFNLLTEDRVIAPNEMVKLLQTSNLNAYHTLRKRLFKHLADFIVLKSTSTDASPASHVNGLLGVVNYLFDKGLEVEAWKYIVIAEGIATQNHYHDVLNTIYLLQIEKAHFQRNIELNAMVVKYEKNIIILRQEEKLKIAISLLRARLIQAKTAGAEIKFQELVTTTLERLNLSTEILEVPILVLNLLKIIRSGIIIKKDFNGFEPYLIANFNRLYKNKNAPENLMVKSEFIYMIAHTSYRNKKFNLSIEYLDQLALHLKECSKPFQKQFEAKMVQLKAANYVFTNRLEEAIAGLQELYKVGGKISTEEHLNTVVNLGIYHALNEESEKSKQLLNELSHSDNWYKKTMGIEWALKKSLLEILLYSDLGMLDLVETRIRSFERNYKGLKANVLYKNAFNFIKLIKNFLFQENRSAVDLEADILMHLDFESYELEDIQAMAFYAWIKSKAVKKEIYPTLLELVES